MLYKGWLTASWLDWQKGIGKSRFFLYWDGLKQGRPVSRKLGALYKVTRQIWLSHLPQPSGSNSSSTRCCGKCLYSIAKDEQDSASPLNPLIIKKIRKKKNPKSVTVHTACPARTSGLLFVLDFKIKLELFSPSTRDAYTQWFSGFQGQSWTTLSKPPTRNQSQEILRRCVDQVSVSSRPPSGREGVGQSTLQKTPRIPCNIQGTIPQDWPIQP